MKAQLHYFKRSLLSIALFLICSFHLKASVNSASKATGSIIYDAILMQKYKDGSDHKLLLDILSTYDNKKLTGTSKELLEEFKDNRFLHQFITNYWKDPVSIQPMSTPNETSTVNTPDNILGNIASVMPSPGGLDVTNIADGFSKFIVKRTKQELSIEFFDKFKQSLDSIPDLQTVFPQTYRALGAMDKDIYMFEAYIQTLRESFENDLASLPSNLPSIITIHENYFNAMPELKAELRSAFYIAQSIQDKQHPGEIIENYPTDYWEKCNPNYQAAFNALKLFSKSFKDSAAMDSYWAPYSVIKNLGSDTDLLKIYLGLVELQAKVENIVFVKADGTSILFSKIIDTAFTDYSKYKPFLTSISLKTKQLESQIKGLKKIKNDSLLFENYYSMISSSLDLIKFSVSVQKLPYFPKLKVNLDSITREYFDVAQTSCDIGIDVNRRNYSSAIVNSIHLYDIIFKSENLSVYINGLDANTKKSEEKIYISKRFDDIRKSFFKYGSFIAAVVQAKNSDEVEIAIEAFALPIGSARIKRESQFNVSFNAYCGLFAGQGAPRCISFSVRPPVNAFGVTAPVGIALNWGHSLWPFTHGIKCGSSSTLFLSVVDLGAVTAFRFVNDTIKSLSKIKLIDIVSPGIFYSIGIPKSPISVNIGYQLTPFLREVSASNNTLKPSYSRFSISLCVDLPMLNLYTTPRD